MELLSGDAVGDGQNGVEDLAATRARVAPLVSVSQVEAHLAHADSRLWRQKEVLVLSGQLGDARHDLKR
jgi:hypothetical protein